MADDHECDSAAQLAAAQRDVLLPTIALLVSAIRLEDRAEQAAAIQSGRGLQLPDAVWRMIGLGPAAVGSVKVNNNLHRLLLTALNVGPLASYWARLLPMIQPQVVLDIEVVCTDHAILAAVVDYWLDWDWHVSQSQQLQALNAAAEQHRQLAQQIDWIKLAVQSVDQAPSSALLDALQQYLNRHRPHVH